MTVTSEYTVSARIREVMRLEPAADALQFRDRWYSWDWLQKHGDALQGILTDVGAPESVSVAMIMRNRPGTVALILSLLTHGQTLVTVSAMQPDDRLADEISGLPAAIVVADREDWSRPGVREAAATAGSVAIALDDEGIELLEPLRRNDAADLAAPGTAILMLTSGTTGPPKRIPLTYAGFDAGYAGTTHYESGSGDVRLRRSVAIVMAPLLHVSGIFTLLLNVQAGRKIALLERFVVDDWLALVTEHRPKAITLPPAALRMVMAAGVDPERLSFARSVLVGTAPIGVDEQVAWEDQYGIPILVVYGATEFAGGIAGWTLDDHSRFAATKRGSVGRAHPGVELRIVDEVMGQRVDVDADGLLEVKAPQLGQRGSEWVRTTDRARLDADGFLWITGRADDVIIRGGFKVSTGAVAARLVAHPAVRDAGVVGLDDVRLGQVPVAAVEVEADAGVDEATLIAFARERLAPYQVPVRVHVVDELPRTPSLKVSGPQLRELLEAAESQGG